MTDNRLPGQPLVESKQHMLRTLSYAVVSAILLSIPFVFFSTFTGISWFDDEGTLLIGFRSLHDGYRMYDDIYSLYGPLYNAIYGLFYAGLSIPLTHTTGRLMAGTAWLAYTAGFAVLCYRLTCSVAAMLACYVLLLLWLSSLMDSPGHPEELCLLLLVAVLLLACLVQPLCSSRTIAALGIAMVGLALVKINVGVYVGGAMALVLLQTTTPGRWRRIALPAVAAGLLLLPPVVQSLLFDMEWARQYAVFVVLAVVAALLVFLNPPVGLPAEQPAIRPGQWLTMATAGGLAGIGIIGGMMLAGSSARAMLDAVVLQNTHFARNWYLPLQVGPSGLAAAILSLLAACGSVAAGQRAQLHGYRDAGILILKCEFIVAGTMLLALPAQAFCVLGPFCWLVMVQPATADRSAPARQMSFGRRATGMVGALMLLYPFPVAGHQISIGALLPVLIIPVLTHDVLLALQARGAVRLVPGRLAALLAGFFLLVVGAMATIAAARGYRRDMPLGLPGTSLIRVDPTQAEDLRWVTAQLEACNSSYSMPGMFSFSLWTDQPLPTALNINDTLAFILPARQKEIVRALERQPNLCVVYNPDYLQSFDRGQIQEDPPLLRYLLTDFAPVAKRHGFVILKHLNIAH